MGGSLVDAERRGLGVPDFRALVGERGWADLSPMVRARFDPHAHGAPRAYPGVMHIRASRFGRLIAHLLRLFGTPIAPWTGEAVSVDVLTWPSAEGGLVWDRTYAFPGRAPVTITSRKAMARDGSLMEIAHGGLGMHLCVAVEARALVFRSRGYFWRVAGIRLPIPALFTPGRAVIVHRDDGAGVFTFQMRFVHPFAGETFFQQGRFRDPSARMIEASEPGATFTDSRLGQAA